MVNHAAEARFAASVMREVVGDAAVDDAFPAVMGAEDFAHMLRVRPGCYAFIGNGDGAHRLPDHGPGPCIIHNTSFDFNDAIIPVGASYFVRLAQRWPQPNPEGALFMHKKNWTRRAAGATLGLLAAASTPRRSSIIRIIVPFRPRRGAELPSPAPSTTSWARCWARRSSWKTAPARAAPSAPRWWPRPRPTATLWC